MTTDTLKNCLFLAVVASLVSLLAGWIFCAVADNWDWQENFMMPVLGLVTGLAVMIPVSSGRNTRIVVGLVATVAGIGMLTCNKAEAVWDSGSHIEDGDMEEYCIRITSLGLCHERKVMGVFDYADVPRPIRREAQAVVAQMTRQEKLALCDKIFASRINTPEKSQFRHRAAATGWVVLSLLACMTPSIIKYRNK